ncbi:MAG: precorrin-6Y C5,15-methyltransferase (decarboxylating) subunit CbiT [Lachnospiraceae bacterium]|nr:precorrin-6Y C5,15-methyltransferase (decarboxylating) subunit CbiT [Lachnospiraceae bacterium]
MRLGIPDNEFIRGRVPMTKEEIRILTVVKLRLNEESVVYDIGAGTGSVSVEMAGQCRRGMVYAVEKNAEGIDLIYANRRKFGIENMEIVKGEAPACLETLPVPTHVFVGGSGGDLIDIIKSVRKKNPEVRFVVNAVTLEKLVQLQELCKQIPEYADMEMIQVGVSRSRLLGNHHLMLGENPVYIAVFGAEK